ncbi:hypothetical protein QTP70_000689 [Hemibagrus guttatus]|uniref:ribonuclease H n=1 Tax=Hemibagrus guttatus TaxID=175788 RepID=A0AAE0RC93_9TELE|nr:hypothetical protein QTP70_000689 [Hemibagrus guttatus]
MRKSGVAEKYVRVVQDMYERSRTVVRCAVGQTKEFKVEVGLHQGSALSPFLFAIVMDQLLEEVRQESPWTMMFADDIVICSESREQVEENLERWRFALERRGMKVSRSKTEYMCVNEREGSGTVRLQGEEVKKVQEFKYLGSTVQSNGECGKEVKKRVQAGWNGWRKVSGVLCDRKISARLKGKVYRTVVRPAMLYGLETVSLRKRQESELEVAELKMLRFSLGVTSLDRIRNEYIRGTADVGRLGDKVGEARLRWFGHVQRRKSEYIGRRMLDMELPGRRQRGRPKRRILIQISCLKQISLPPSPIAPPQLLRAGSTYLIIQLNTNSILGDGPIIRREIEYRATHAPWSEINGVNMLTYKLWHLDPDTEYHISVLLTRPGEGGTGPPGPPLISRTKCAEPMRALRDLRSSEIQARQLTLQWEPLAFNLTRCYTYSVSLCYRYAIAGGTGGAGHNTTIRECLAVEHNTSRFTLRDLPPYHTIHVRLALANTEGKKEGKEVMFQTEEDIPGGIAPESLTFTPLDDMVFLKWEEPVEPNDYGIDHFSQIPIEQKWRLSEMAGPPTAIIYTVYIGMTKEAACGGIEHLEILCPHLSDEIIELQQAFQFIQKVLTGVEISYQSIESSDPGINVPGPRRTVSKLRNETYHMFSNLHPGTTYLISVRARTAKGFGQTALTEITTNISAEQSLFSCSKLNSTFGNIYSVLKSTDTLTPCHLFNT